MAYWSVARLQPHRERLALQCLGLAGFTVYLPRLRPERVSRGRSREACPPLFPGYAFVSIELQWSKARYGPGIVGLIMNGASPARVPDRVVAEICSREVGGLVELSKTRAFRRGDHVRIRRGPFAGRWAIFADMKPHERVEVVLGLLGGEQRATLAATDVLA